MSAMTGEHGTLIGRQIGVYRVVSLLGAGGMGEVYRARDTKLGRDVATSPADAALWFTPTLKGHHDRQLLGVEVNHRHGPGIGRPPLLISNLGHRGANLGRHLRPERMTMAKNRRDFLKMSLGALTTGAWSAAASMRAQETPRAPRIRFAAVGLNHGHITGQVEAVIRGGGQLVSYYAKEPELTRAFAQRFPAAKLARSEREILEDPTIQLVVSAAIPNERAPLGVRSMQHGKDFMSDKPAATTLEQLADVRRVQAATKRIYSVLVGRHEQQATSKAGELVRSGAIGRVLQTLSIAPHRINPKTRPSWFFERERYGGILCDLASHSIDEFLFFTGSTQGEVVASQVANLHHPEYAELEDFGDLVLRGNSGTGYVRVDWFTPSGLSTFGDGRLTILGTDGYIEIRKTIDITGRPGGDHLFLVDQKETRYVDSSSVALPYGQRLVDDALNRTETACPQMQTFLAMELALRAQKDAHRLTLAPA